jgi:phenylalanyl-tRNA synthetase beta chain
MKISYSWLQEFLDLEHTAIEIGEMLTSVGLEVEDIIKYETVKGSLAGLVVGNVIDCVQHPNADKLKITKVDIGLPTNLNIVCGAPNVAVGQKVIVATVGTTIYPTTGEPIKLIKAKIRGEVSEGMICALDEIGLGSDHSGIMILDNNIATGTAVASLYALYSDTVFEIGLTPNRADAFSHLGVARELQAYYKTHLNKWLPLKREYSYSPSLFSATQSPISLQVMDTTKCPSYAGVYIANVTIKETSIALQNRLKAIGIKPINEIVDITNFILNDCGQPLHAFDADKIEGQQIIVTTAQQGESFIGLDEKVRQLRSNDLVICNATAPMCIAGVYGGLHSGITANTKNIFIESAYFNPSAIRTTSYHHQLRTDSALHFEKGIDKTLNKKALSQAVALLHNLQPNINVHQPIAFEADNKTPLIDINLNINNVNKLIGFTIPNITIENILTGLGFLVNKKSEDNWSITVPSFKTDITLEVDLIEEIIRLFGLDAIPINSNMQFTIPIRNVSNDKLIEERALNFLCNNGFSEIINNSIVPSKQPNNQNENSVKLLNSINTELDMLRSNLINGALEVVAFNQNRQQANLKLFELAKIYTKSENKYTEEKQLIIISTGNISEPTWQTKEQPANYFYHKKIVNQLLATLGCKKIKYTIGSQLNTINIAIDQVIVGTISIVPAESLEYFGIKNIVIATTIYWDILQSIIKKKTILFKPIAKYPHVKRDLALIINKNITFEQLEKIAKKTVGNILKSINLFDIYLDTKLGDDKKSNALSFTLQDENATLTEDKIEQTMNQLINAYTNEIGAIIRNK